ncbi:MAG: histidine--tRNA ligase [Thermoanaerobaculia bacterium]
MINSVKGTRDIIPPFSYIWNRTEEIAIKTFSSYGYLEIRTPILEHLELFQRSIGEDTEIVNKEMYVFKDRKGRDLALRPEGTAPVARAYLSTELKNQLHPLRLFYIGPMFRYERPQKGRYRQFYQIGAELLGLENPEADGEMLEVLIVFLKNLGFKELEILINSVGCDLCRKDYVVELKDYFEKRASQLCENCKDRLDKNPLRILDCKEEKCQPLKEKAPSISNFLCPDCKRHFEETLKLLEKLSIPFNINKNLVRGLDYYTRTVFEVVSKELGAQNALCGGGRYNKLISDLGGPPVPGIGFAIGEDRLIEILPEKFIEENSFKVDYFLIPVSQNETSFCFHIAQAIRKKGFVAITFLEGKGLKKGLKDASSLKAKNSIIIGEEEIKSGTLTIKEMATGFQKTVPIQEFLEGIK